MKKLTWNDCEYEIIENNKDGFDKDAFLEKVTEYFEPFDYLLGDWSYGKLRLKGFYESNRKETKKINDIAFYLDYIDTCCSYGCRYFLLKKQK